MNKIRKALELADATFVHTLDPCPKGWDYHPQYSQELGHLAVETGIWPLYEVMDGVCNLTGPTRQIARAGRSASRVYEYLKRQGRFAHFIDEDVRAFQAQVDKMWTDLAHPGRDPVHGPAKDLGDPQDRQEAGARAKDGVVSSNPRRAEGSAAWPNPSRLGPPSTSY